MMFLSTPLLRMIRSLTHIAVLQKCGQSPALILLLKDFVLYRLYDKYRLPVWLGCAISIVELSTSSNYGTFVVEW